MFSILSVPHNGQGCSEIMLPVMDVFLKASSVFGLL